MMTGWIPERDLDVSCDCKLACSSLLLLESSVSCFSVSISKKSMQVSDTELERVGAKKDCGSISDAKRSRERRVAAVGPPTTVFSQSI